MTSQHLDDRLELCWATLGGADLPTQIAAAAAAGFGAITVAPMKFGQFLASGGTPDEARARLRDVGVRVTGVDALLTGLPGPPRPEDIIASNYAAAFDYGENDCYRYAEALRAESINIAHYLGTPTSVASLVDAIGAIRARAHDHGLRTTLEFIPATSVPDVATAYRIVSEIGESDLTVLVDTWHLARSGGGATDVAVLPSDAIGGAQISDAGPELGALGEGRLLPGVGVLPLAEIIDVVARATPRVRFGVEVISPAMAQLPAFEAARRAAESMRALLGPADD